jgi:hypothetical protein
MRNNIKTLSFLFTVAIVILSSCNHKIDKSKFNFESFITDNNDYFVEEFEKLKVDTAFIQLIGYTPSKEDKKADFFWKAEENKYDDDFFDEYDLDEQPIINVWALHQIVVKGNGFADGGLSASDLIDYESGVSASDAQIIYQSGNYTRNLYEYWQYNLFFKNGSPKLFTDNSDNPFYDDLINNVFNVNTPEIAALKKEQEHASQKIGMYIKGKGITIVSPDQLNLILSKKFKKETSNEASTSELGVQPNSETPAAAASEDETATASSSENESEISSGLYLVVSDKCYFYAEPNLNNKQKAYLVKGQSGEFSQFENGFVYATFTYKNKTTEGWLKSEDLEISQGLD